MSTDFRAVTHVRLYETVAEQIKELVRSNKLKPGDRLPPERELAAMLSISRGSLREACRVLESRGLIKSTPGGGRSIREVDRENIIDTGNAILDVAIGKIPEPERLSNLLNITPGVVDHGLFIGICGIILMGTKDGVKTFRKQ